MDAAQSLLALLLGGAMAVAIYALLCVPGIIVLKVMRTTYPSIYKRKYLLAGIWSTLFAPAPLWSHTPIIVPPYVDVVVLYTSIDSTAKDVLLLIGTMVTFFVVSLYWKEWRRR